jgi:glycosyltransferase involved in cell wall biosynthesis
MKIMHMIPQLSGGGTERQLSYLAPELVRMGHEVHVAYSMDGPDRPQLPGVVLHRLKSGSNCDPSLLWQILRLTRRLKPDIIHTSILQMDILGGIAAKLNKVPWIFREPSSAMAYVSNWKQRLRVRVGSAARAIVSNSAGGDEYWRNWLPLSRRYVIANGLPLSEIENIAAALPPGISDSQTPIVLYVGRLASGVSATKNLKAFLESLAYVERQHRVQGIFCGEGPQRLELEMLRRELGLKDNVHFTGHLPGPAVWALMKKAAVFVSLSAYEGCPNSVMEAMSCSCPLVLSDIPAHREILDESCALFVEPFNIQQTADTILQILTNVGASKARAMIARRKAQEWPIAEMARNYERVYEEMRLSTSHELPLARPWTGDGHVTHRWML